MTPSTADYGKSLRGLRASSWSIAVLTGVSLLSGCGGDKHDESLGTDAPSAPTGHVVTPPSASARANSSDVAQEAAKAEVIAVYRHYWHAQIKAYAKASPVGTDLNKFAFDKALGKTKGDLISMQQKGNVLRGAVKIDPKVTSIRIGEGPKRAAVTDCTDVSGWQLVNEKTGKPVALPEQRLTRFLTDVTVRTVGDQWMVVDVQQTDRTC